MHLPSGFDFLRECWRLKLLLTLWFPVGLLTRRIPLLSMSWKCQASLLGWLKVAVCGNTNKGHIGHFPLGSPVANFRAICCFHTVINLSDVIALSTGVTNLQVNQMSALLLNGFLFLLRWSLLNALGIAEEVSTGGVLGGLHIKRQRLGLLLDWEGQVPVHTHRVWYLNALFVLLYLLH